MWCGGPRRLLRREAPSLEAESCAPLKLESPYESIFPTVIVIMDGSTTQLIFTLTLFFTPAFLAVAVIILKSRISQPASLNLPILEEDGKTDLCEAVLKAYRTV